MNRNLIIGILIGLVVGFLAGFVFTNNVNRRETERGEIAASRAAESSSPRPAAASDQTPPITPEQVKAAIARADAEPRDIFLQRQLGQALYLLGDEGDNADLLLDAIRLLERAHQLDADNFDTLVLLGNAHFAFAQARDRRRFAEARSYYLKALRRRPDDVRVRTDYGLSYFYSEPSEPQRAIEEYERALGIEPRSETTLQHLAAALISTADFARARQTLDALRQINPNNNALADLQARLAVRNNEAMRDK